MEEPLCDLITRVGDAHEPEHSDVKIRMPVTEVGQVDPPDVLAVRDDVADVHIAVQAGGRVRSGVQEGVDLGFLGRIEVFRRFNDAVEMLLDGREHLRVAGRRVEFLALLGEDRHVFIQILRLLRDGARKRAFVGDALEFNTYALAVRHQAVGPGNIQAEVHNGPGHLQFLLRHCEGNIVGIELHHPLSVLVVVADGGITVATFLVTVQVDQFGLRQAEDVLDVGCEFAERVGPGQLVERLGEAAVMPLVVDTAVRRVEAGPELVAQLVVVAGNGPHIRELVAERHHLGIARCRSNAVDGRLLAVAPAVGFADAFHELVAFGFDQRRHPLAEFTAKVFQCHARIFHHVVQRGGGQEFLVGGHRGDDGHRLQGMYDIGESFSTALRIVVRLHCIADGFVKQGAVDESVCHITYREFG